MERHPYYKLNYSFKEGKMFKDIISSEDVVNEYRRLLESVNDESEAIHETLRIFATSKDQETVAETRKMMKDIVTKKFKNMLSASSKQILYETIDMLIVYTINEDNENDRWNYDQWCFQSQLAPKEEELF